MKHGLYDAIKIVDTIARGEIGQPYGVPLGLRVDITLDDHQAVISLYREKESESWVLSGYKIDERLDAKGRGSDLSSATQFDPIRTREELGAILSSESKIDEIFGKYKENASKVVDENGEPMVVYHGTSEDFDVFDRSKSRANMDIQGNFFSPWEEDARGYGSNVRAFFLDIKNPADERAGYGALNRYKGRNGAGIQAREYLIEQGYDGVNNGNEEYITFEANQIKSATDNNGDFSRENDDVRFRVSAEEYLTRYNAQRAESDRQVEKMETILSALKDAGFNVGYNGFHISRSITDWGVSTYIQGSHGVKIRLSDHRFTSHRRFLGEKVIEFDTPAESVVEYVKAIDAKLKERDAIIEAQREQEKERKRLLDEKWDRIKGSFEGYYFVSNDTGTYKHYEEIEREGNKVGLLQKAFVDPNGKIAEDKWRYEWAEKGKNPYGKKKPSYEWLEAYNEELNDVETTRFRMANDTRRYNKRTVEKGFGGIWIDDKEEFAKFAKAVKNYAFEEDGEGVCYTDNYFYAYYRNIDGEVIPFVLIYLNAEDSQELVNSIRQHYDGSIREEVKQRVNRIIEGFGSDEGSSDISYDDRDNSETSTPHRKVVNDIFRKGRYLDSPRLYVKGKRVDGREKRGVDEQTRFRNAETFAEAE